MKMCAANGCSMPVFGKGYCKRHQYMRSDFDRRTPLQKHLDNVANGKAIKYKSIDDKAIELNEKNYAPASLQRWFKDRRKEMTGRCANCGGMTLRNLNDGKDDEFNDKYYKHFAAHILQKAYFPSVATHPSNWIELCFFGNSCHTNMDNHILDLTDMSCWDTIVKRFQEMYPSIAPKERRRIPKVLLEYIGTDL